jgi:hypothetical protein
VRNCSLPVTPRNPRVQLRQRSLCGLTQAQMTRSKPIPVTCI